MIKFEVNQVPYTGCKLISIYKSMEDLSSSFTVEISRRDNKLQPNKFLNAIVTFSIENERIFTGYIEKLSNNMNDSDDTILLSGRDKLVDVIKSTIKKNLTFNSEISLMSLIQMTLSENNLSNIRVINNVPDITPFSSTEIEATQVGQSIFEFLAKYAYKKQVLLSSNGFGDLVITRSSNTVNGFLINDSVNKKSSNLKNRSYEYDNSERFHTYTILAQGNPASGFDDLESEDFGDTATATLVYTEGSAVDSNIRNTSNLAILVDEAYSQQDCIDRAKWEANIRRVKSINYSCTVTGFKPVGSSKIWNVNTLVKLKDNDADIDSLMLVKSVTYNASTNDGGGYTTQLELIDKNAYTIEVEKSKIDSKFNKSGENITAISEVADEGL